MIENVGSVLIADATGAGKTRMGAHLLKAVREKVWSKGRRRRDFTTLVSPPNQVSLNWKSEALQCQLPLNILSHGGISRKDSKEHDLLIGQIKQAQTLAIDEAHNFFNQMSERTRGILSNSADNIIMFTATPINKSVTDILKIVDLLGADNLEESALNVFDKISKEIHSKGVFNLEIQDRLELKNEIQRFTLRRTKKTLNSMVDVDQRIIETIKGICAVTQNILPSFIISMKAKKISRL